MGGTLELKQQLYGLAANLEILNYDALSDRVGEAKLQQYFQISFASADNSKLNGPKMLQAEAARPWVSPLIWALFKAYWAAIGYGSAIGTIFKLGEDPRRFTSPEKIEEFLSVALPDDINLFRPFRPALIAPALNLIELRLLAAIHEEVTGLIPSISTVQQAQRIAAAASKLSSAITGQQGSSMPEPL